MHLIDSNHFILADHAILAYQPVMPSIGDPVLENLFERPGSEGLFTAVGRQESDQECIHAFRLGGHARDYSGCVASLAKRLQQTLAAADDVNGHQRIYERSGDVCIGLVVAQYNP